MNDETDERSEAFERGLKTMEPIALELYRRGREPLLAELETVKRERDEARAELAALRKRVVEALPYPTDDDSDESRTAEEAIEMAVAERDAAYRSRDLAIKMWDEARAEVEYAYREGGALYEAKIAEREAYRRGAEAMREACAGALLADGLVLSRERAANVVRAMPIPEEP